MDPVARFWKKVEITDPDGCWLWTASVRKGYGQFALRPQHVVAAHRHAYESLIGPIPDGLEVDHLCRVHRCVNPAHLEPVTHAVNMGRSLPGNASVTYCPAGHEYDEANTYTHNGKRHCRACNRRRSREYQARKRGGPS